MVVARAMIIVSAPQQHSTGAALVLSTSVSPSESFRSGLILQVIGGLLGDGLEGKVPRVCPP